MYEGKDKVAARIALIAILAGIAARAWSWWGRGSLFLDEASLALNVLGRPLDALHRPLEWGQAAPVGFLWIEKIATTWLGPAEWVLRLWPFIAGALVLPLAWLVGRRIVGERAAALTTVALAASLIAIRYSTEAKPYAPDAFFALLLVWLAVDVHDDPRAARPWILLGAAGVLAVLCSIPAAFVLGGVVLALLPSLRGADAGVRRAALAAMGAWGMTFAALWLVVYRHGASDAYLREYWAPVMLTPGTKDFGGRVLRAAASVASSPLQWPASWVVAVGGMDAWLAGLLVIGKRSRPALALLGAPIFVAAAASVVGAYPLSDRLAFFAVPLALIASGAATVWLFERWIPRIATPATVVVALAVAAWVGKDSWRLVRNPGQLEPTRELFQAVAAEAARTQAPVYVFARAAPAWLYATTNWRAVERRRFDAYRVLTGPTESPAHENFAGADVVTSGAGNTFSAQRGPLVELVGLAPGARYRIVGATSRDGPSPGWAREEARRIAAAAAGARGEAWVVASHFFEGTERDELRPLVEAITAAGLRVVDERRGGRDAVALRVTR